MKTFKLLERTIEIPENLDAYNAIFVEFSKKARDAKRRFISAYRENINSLDTLSEKAFEIGMDIINEEISKIVSEIIDGGYYNVNEDTFYEEYFQDLFDWNDAYDKVNDLYLDIMFDEDEKDKHRVANRKNRGKMNFESDYSLEGAIVGLAATAAVNVASELAYMGFNAVAKAGSSAIAATKKATIFKDKSTLGDLADSIYTNVFSLHFAFIKFKAEKLDDVIELIPEEKTKEALTLFKNATERELAEDVKLDLLIQSVNANPYNDVFYEYIVKTYGDENLETQQFVSYLGFELLEYKASLVDKYFEQFVISTEDTALNCKEELLLKMKFLGITATDITISSLEEVEKALTNFDVAARTVDSILFDTRDEALLANQEKEIMERALLNFDDLDEQTLLEHKKEFSSQNFKTIIKKSYLLKIEERLIEIDVKVRTIDDILFRTREEATLAVEEKAIVETKLENFDSLDEDALKSINEDILALNLKTVIVNSYFEKINNKLKQFDIEARTVGDEVFETREEAKTLRDFLDARNAKIDEALNVLIPVILDSKYEAVAKNFYYLNQNTSVESKFKHAVKSYAKLEKHERPLFIFDNSLLKNGDKGFLITNKAVYASSQNEVSTAVNTITGLFGSKKAPAPALENNSAQDNFVLIGDITTVTGEPQILSFNNLKCYNSNKKNVDVFEDLLKTIVEELKKI